MITITDALRGEHGVFASLFNQIEKAALAGVVGSHIRPMFELIQPALEIHNALEEELISPALMEVPAVSPSLRMMQIEHRQLDELFGRIWNCADHEVADTVLLFIEKQRSHLHKEEEFLYTLVDEYLSVDQLQQLGREWVRRRGLGPLSQPAR